MTGLEKLPRQSWPIRNRGPWRHIYIIQEGEDGPVKVGIAANAFWRINELQVGNYRRLRLIAVFVCADKRKAFEIEQWAHFQLEDCHLGGEWFNAHPDEVVALFETGAQ